MSDHQDNTTQAPIYQIRIEGHLGDHWADVFDGLDMILTTDGDTLLHGSVVDQAALHGLLRRIRDSGMTLVSVRRVQSGDANQSNDHPQNE
jgi:hypothetical protein